ncbi:hypothetical protein EYZ11_013136 [Aspergillus tanneri]|uniref:Reverse transcriptase Ty1/copia-type domain-containing protein n=1 Tax=Aspergillus tanneri TaxID=1220188 RepID=A0A4S3J0L5_9EURO|nr:hypothetical protein EYZ11_013136 [Aspergillus tanneri]
MNVHASSTGIRLSQEDYIRELVDSYGLQDAHPTKTPLDPGTVIDDTADAPDICRAACYLAEFNAAPTPKAWAALMHVLKYLKGTPTLGIEYQRRSTTTTNISPPIAYSDSDWGGPHTKARRSVGGYVFMLAGGPVSWQAKRQTCVAASSNEAEYITASEAAREARWIREIINNLRLFKESPAPSILLHMDNKGAIDLTSANIQTKRSKHIDIRYHYPLAWQR